MKSRALFAAILFGFAASLFAASSPRIFPLPKPAANSPAFVADKGKFRILLQGNEAGTEEFDFAPSGNAWIAHGETVVRVPGSGETRSSGHLRVAADGTPLHYDWTAQTDKRATGTVEFDNGTAKTSTTLAGKPPILTDFKFTSPHVAVLDNNLYDQYAIIGRLYDWNAKGSQTFPVLIPQDVTPGSISVESQGSQTVAGGAFDVLEVRSADLMIDLYFDAKHRLMRLEVPSAKVIVVRQ